MTKIPGHHKLRQFEFVADFYLWGLLPTQHLVYLDREFSNQGLMSVANVSIEEYTTFLQSLKTFLSLGIYSVRTFRVAGYGKEVKDMDFPKGEGP